MKQKFNLQYILQLHILKSFYNFSMLQFLIFIIYSFWNDQHLCLYTLVHTLLNLFNYFIPKENLLSLKGIFMKGVPVIIFNLYHDHFQHYFKFPHIIYFKFSVISYICFLLKLLNYYLLNCFKPIFLLCLSYSIYVQLIDYQLID